MSKLLDAVIIPIRLLYSGLLEPLDGPFIQLSTLSKRGLIKRRLRLGNYKLIDAPYLRV